MYISKIRAEEETSRKQSDDLLTKADAIIDKGDIVIKFRKLVLKAEKDFAFDVNYTSGTVLERNSLLNMAVINQRKNIAKWLVEEKNCDIETCDRGNFTPLLNAGMCSDHVNFRSPRYVPLTLSLLTQSLEWRQTLSSISFRKRCRQKKNWDLSLIKRCGKQRF